jgi:hypothetical protein
MCAWRQNEGVGPYVFRLPVVELEPEGDVNRLRVVPIDQEKSLLKGENDSRGSHSFSEFIVRGTTAQPARGTTHGSVLVLIVDRYYGNGDSRGTFRGRGHDVGRVTG